MKRRIAFFDFDGTITTHDTLLEIIKYYKGSFRFYAGFVLYSPVMLAYKMGIISNQSAKERMLRHFFSGISIDTFQQMCDAFAETKMPALIRPKAIIEIQKLKELGAECVIVSASATNWLSSWCEKYGLAVLATRMEIKNDRVTGKLLGKNCHGDEKVTRIKEAYDLSQYDEILCYGDTKGDKPMLGLATFSFYKPFR